MVNIYPDAPWCWNIYLHLPQESPSFVGKYTIHGASGYGVHWKKWLEKHFFFQYLTKSNNILK